MSNPTHKTLKNGSIDYNHYIQHGRQVRSHAAHALIKSLWTWLTGNQTPITEARSAAEITPITPARRAKRSNQQWRRAA